MIATLLISIYPLTLHAVHLERIDNHYALKISPPPLYSIAVCHFFSLVVLLAYYAHTLKVLYILRGFGGVDYSQILLPRHLMMILSPSHRNSSRVFAILLTYHGQQYQDDATSHFYIWFLCFGAFLLYLSITLFMTT